MLTQGPAFYDLMRLVKMAAIMYTINKSSAALSRSESLALMLRGLMSLTDDLWTLLIISVRAEYLEICIMVNLVPRHKKGLRWLGR